MQVVVDREWLTAVEGARAWRTLVKFGLGSSIDLWIQSPHLECLMQICMIRLACLICLCLCFLQAIRRLDCEPEDAAGH